MPNSIYHANFRAIRQRDSGFPDSVTFAAADDVVAATIAGHIAGALSSKMVSLTKRIHEHNPHANHPVGSRLTATAIMMDAAGHIARFRARNMDGDVSNDEIVHLLTDGIGPIGAAVLVPYGTNLLLPNSMAACETVTVTIVTKP